MGGGRGEEEGWKEGVVECIAGAKTRRHVTADEKEWEGGKEGM